MDSPSLTANRKQTEKLTHKGIKKESQGHSRDLNIHPISH